MPTSTRSETYSILIGFGECDTILRADVGIGPYEPYYRRCYDKF